MVYQHRPNNCETFHEAKDKGQGKEFKKIISFVYKYILCIQFHLHGNDFASLQEFVPASSLPEEYSGELELAETYSAVHLFSEELGATSTS